MLELKACAIVSSLMLEILSLEKISWVTRCHGSLLWMFVFISEKSENLLIIFKISKIITTTTTTVPT